MRRCLERLLLYASRIAPQFDRAPKADGLLCQRWRPRAALPNAVRERAAALAEEGGRRRAVARLADVAVSAAVHWRKQWTTTGSLEAKPGAGDTRSLYKEHEQWLLDLVAK